jgi:hypothetical protein
MQNDVNIFRTGDTNNSVISTGSIELQGPLYNTKGEIFDQITQPKKKQL